jgi:hypothetical protein
LDKKGYVIGGLSFLLIVPSILLLMVLIDMVNLDESSNTLLKSDNTYYIIGDVEENIPPMTRQVLKETAEDVIKTGNSIPNSKLVIKNTLQSKINDLIGNYTNNTGVTIKCVVNSINPGLDPFEVEVNSSILAVKDNISYSRNICQNVSILGLSSYRFSGESNEFYEIPDPLPFIKCKNHGGTQVINNRIAFGSSLTNYLESRGVKNAIAYENSTTAYIIKKCPYDPYKMHGEHDYNTLKNCIDNGYFHESSDGSCFLCRLEGKGVCPHYGMETYITPAPSANTTYNSSNSNTNFTLNLAPSSIDHVIFNDTNLGSGTYQGNKLIYYSDTSNLFIIFLDKKA